MFSFLGRRLFFKENIFAARGRQRSWFTSESLSVISPERGRTNQDRKRISQHAPRFRKLYLIDLSFRMIALNYARVEFGATEAHM